MGSDNKNNGGGGVEIPVTAKKTLQNIREIIKNKCTESEIYAVLRDCNMDPNEAVHKLISQDTFREVKSKRERRKEIKETQESRAWGNNSTFSRGVRVGEYTAGRSGSIQSSSNELGKAGYKRENGSVAPSSLYSSTSSVYHATGRSLNEQPSPQCDSFNADNRRQTVGTGDSTSSYAQASPGYQSAWIGATTGHASLADIVRMGKPHSKGSQMSSEPSYTHEVAVANSYHYCAKPPLVPGTPQPEMNENTHSSLPLNTSEMIHESGITSDQPDFDNGWPVIEQQTAASGSSVLDASASSDAEIYSNQSYSSRDRANLSRNCQSDEVQLSERDVTSDNVKCDSIGYASAFGGQKIVNSAGVVSPCNDMSSDNSHVHMCKHQEGIDTHLSFPNHSAPLTNDVITAVSSAAADLRQLNLGKESTVPPTEDNCSLVFPNNLQALAADCPQLNFGTYKSSRSSASSVPLASSPLKGGLQEDFATRVGSSAVQLDTRNSVYRGDGQLGFMNDTRRVTADTKNYDSQFSLQPELMKQDIPDAVLGHEYMSTSSVPDSNFKNTHPQNSGFPVVINPKPKNLPPLASELRSYTNGIPSDSFASAVQSLRPRVSEPLPPLLAKQSVPTRYSSAVSSMNNPTVSMSEVLNSGAFSLPQQPFSHTLPGASFATRAVLPQQLSAHSNSQHSPSLGELANMIGYRSMPESYAYMPALQYSYADSRAYHEPLAGMKYNHNLLQWASGARKGSLPLSNSANPLSNSANPLSNNANASGYGSFGSSSNIPGNFMHNIPTAPTGTTTVGYDNSMRPQYKHQDNFTLLQQNDNSAAWDYGPGSRTMPASSDNAYYSLLGQNQQLSGYRQHQNSLQHYGAPGYPDVRHSQTGIRREHQPQSLSDLSSVGSQGLSSKQLHQTWQHDH